MVLLLLPIHGWWRAKKDGEGIGGQAVDAPGLVCCDAVPVCGCGW